MVGPQGLEPRTTPL